MKLWSLLIYALIIQFPCFLILYNINQLLMSDSEDLSSEQAIEISIKKPQG